MTDDELLVAIGREIAESPFVGEGHKKLRAPAWPGGASNLGQARAALDPRGRAAGSPAAGAQASRRLHDAAITVAVPDTLWATDATEAHTRHEGRCAVFAIVDHATGEAWVDASARRDRWAAADLLREACTERFGSVDPAVAAELALRYDGGSCFRAAHYQAEVDFLVSRAHRPTTTRARDQRLGREVHRHAQRAGVVDRTLRHPRPAPCSHPRVRRELPPALAAGAPRLPHPHPSARDAPSGAMA